MASARQDPALVFARRTIRPGQRRTVMALLRRAGVHQITARPPVHAQDPAPAVVPAIAPPRIPVRA